MKRFLKIIVGLLFPLYGLYLIIRWYVKTYKLNQEKLTRKLENESEQIENISKKIKFLDTSGLLKSIKENESIILKYDKEKLQDFVRCEKFISKLESSITSKFKKSDKTLQSYIQLKNDCKGFNLIVRLSHMMVHKLSKNDIVDFLSIYEKLEEIGCFRSSYENQMLFKLDSLSGQLNEISNQLKSIDGKLNYQNLLLTYNTVQLHSIKKSLKNN